MKKLFLISVLCLMCILIQAQSIAVLHFNGGAGVSQNDADGLTGIFITYFHPKGYTIVERTQIDKVIEEQGFQSSNMTQSQMVRVGEILNVQTIMIGDINIIMGQFNVDVRGINVETGRITVTGGATFATTSLRDGMQDLAQRLASKLTDYVDLGLPSGTLWKDQNESGGFYTYDQAIAKFGGDLPTKEQLEELKNSCQWTWTGSGYKVTGPSGEFITLPAAGFRDCSGSVNGVGSSGRYWSSTPSGSGYARNLDFNSGLVYMSDDIRCGGLSVRLVQD